MNLASAFASLESFAVKAGTLLQPVLLLLLRLYWGWGFVQAGWGKLTNLGRTAEFFAGLNLPLPYVNAVLAGVTQCVGGGLLALGLCARLSSGALVFTMLVAFATAKRTELLGIFGDPAAFVAADPFPYLLAALMVLAFGAGALSLDAQVRRKT